MKDTASILLLANAYGAFHTKLEEAVEIEAARIAHGSAITDAALEISRVSTLTFKQALYYINSTQLPRVVMETRTRTMTERIPLPRNRHERRAYARKRTK